MKPPKNARLPKSTYWTQIKIIAEFHRAKDGFIAFCRRPANEDRFLPVRSVRASHLRRFTTGRRWAKLTADAFFTPNAYYRNAENDSKPYGPAYRKGRGLKYLNACFVDVDFYKVNLTFKAALREVRRLVREERIPKPSILADSGSGLWLFWLLHDADDKSAPPKGDPKHYSGNFQTWRHIEEALISRLTHLGADPRAKDGARLARIPGSINRKTNRRVQYSPQYADRSQRVSYSLRELADCLQIPRGTPVPKKPPKKKKKKVPAKVRRQTRDARRALFESRLKQLQRLEKHRRGLKEGTRENGLLLFAALMKSLGRKPRLIKQEIIRLGARCHPPLDETASLARVRAADGTKRIRDTTIVEWLNVTAEEKSQLKLTWPVAGEDDSSESENAADTRKSQRQRVLKRLLRRYGVMSARKLRERYAKRDIEVSQATAARDLKSA